MKLTKSEENVIKAVKQSERTHNNWQTCGLTGRTSNSFDSLVRKGILIRDKGIAGYRLV